MNNSFIVFEGIDGSGTTTQASLLYNFYTLHGIQSMLTTEPTSGPIGNLIREIFKGRVVFGGNSSSFDKLMAHLFVADRVDHLYNSIDGVVEALKSRAVISTRYYFSSLAYHARSKKEIDYIFQMNKDFLEPDFVFYIDVPIDVSMARLLERYTKDSYETAERLAVVKKNYEYIFSEIYPKAIRLDGTLKQEEISALVRGYIAES